jgi:hypothetical protein
VSRRHRPVCVIEWSDRLSGRYRLIREPRPWATSKSRSMLVIERHETDALGGDRWVHELDLYPGDHEFLVDESDPARLLRLLVAALAGARLRSRRRRARR